MSVTLLLAGIDAGRRQEDLELELGGSARFPFNVPVTSEKRPRTVAIIRCLTANSTFVCAGSSCQASIDSVTMGSIAVLIWTTWIVTHTE